MTHNQTPAHHATVTLQPPTTDTNDAPHYGHAENLGFNTPST